MTVSAFLNKLPAAFNPEAASGTDCTIQFNVSTPAYLVIKEGSCAVVDGVTPEPSLEITIGDDDLIALLKGELDGMTAFMTGKLQIGGDLMLAQRMGSFFDAARLA